MALKYTLSLSPVGLPGTYAGSFSQAVNVSIAAAAIKSIFFFIFVSF
jgi:hypothetical protein